MPTSLLQAGLLSGLRVYRSCAHSCCEFIRAAVQLCLENTAVIQVSSTMTPEPLEEGCDVTVLLKSGHSVLSYSLHLIRSESLC